MTKTKIVMIALLSLLTLSAFSAINTNTSVQAASASISGSGKIAVAHWVEGVDTIDVCFAEQLKIEDKTLTNGLYVEVKHSNGLISADQTELSLVDPDNLVTLRPDGISIVTTMTFNRGSDQKHTLTLDWNFVEKTATLLLDSHRGGRPSAYNTNNVVYATVTPMASAAVTKDKGNTNTLAITVTAPYFDFATDKLSAPISGTFVINNNAAGTYTVGGYNVYVDTKGNDQIRACYIKP